MVEKELRERILSLVKEYASIANADKEFITAKTTVPFAARYFDEQEYVNLVDSSLDAWLTTGRFAEEFEIQFADFFQLKSYSLVNSGSSANLLAISALTFKKLGKRRLNPGDEVITVAGRFPTTVNPIVQNGLVPVFVDVDIPTYNIKTENLEKAISEKTKAIMFAHTLGNPFNLSTIKKLAFDHNLWIIEDCCDALGSKFKFDRKV